MPTTVDIDGVAMPFGQKKGGTTGTALLQH
jgi:hypothetical protein